MAPFFCQCLSVSTDLIYPATIPSFISFHTNNSNSLSLHSSSQYSISTMFPPLREVVLHDPRPPFSLRRRPRTTRARKRNVEHLVQEPDVNLAATHLHALAISDPQSIPLIVRSIRRYLLPSSTRPLPLPILYSHSVILLHHLVLTVPSFYYHIASRSFFRSFWRLHDSLQYNNAIACNIRLLICAWARDLHPNIDSKDSAATFWVRTYLKLTKHYTFPTPPDRLFVCRAQPVPEDYASQFSYPSLRPSLVPTDGFEKALKMSHQLGHTVPTNNNPWQRRAISNIHHTNFDDDTDLCSQPNLQTPDFDDLHSPSCPVLSCYSNTNDTKKFNFHKRPRKLSAHESHEKSRLHRASLLSDSHASDFDFLSNDRDADVHRFEKPRKLERKRQERVSYLNERKAQSHDKANLSLEKDEPIPKRISRDTSTVHSTRREKLNSVIRRHQLMYSINDPYSSTLPSYNKTWGHFDESSSTLHYSRVTRSTNSTIVSFANGNERKRTKTDSQGHLSVSFSYNADPSSLNEHNFSNINTPTNHVESIAQTEPADDLWDGVDMDIDAPTVPAITPSSFAELVIEENETTHSREYKHVSREKVTADLIDGGSWVPALEDVFQEVESAKEAISPFAKNLNMHMMNAQKNEDHSPFITGEDEEVEEFVSGVLTGGRERKSTSNSHCRLIARIRTNSSKKFRMIQ